MGKMDSLSRSPFISPMASSAPPPEFICTPGNQTCFNSGIGLPSVASCERILWSMYQSVGLNAPRRSSSASAWYACSMSIQVSSILTCANGTYSH